MWPGREDFRECLSFGCSLTVGECSAAPYRASLSNQSGGKDNAALKQDGGRRCSGGRNGMFGVVTAMVERELAAARSVLEPRSRRARPSSTRARTSTSTSATASAAPTTSMRACSPGTWASTSPAIPPWCRRTWRARARCASPTGSTTSAPKDGSAFGIIGRGTGFDPLLGNKAAQFDATKYTWIGSANNEVSVCVAWHTSGDQQVRGPADAGN